MLHWLDDVWRFVQRENLDRLIGLILGLIVLSAGAIALVEPEIGLLDAAWWSIVTLTTVGYGDISPVTPAGRVVALVLMFSGIGILAAFSATIASVLVDRKIKDDLGMSIRSVRDHMILCEWNYQTRGVLRDLRADPHTAETPIVLIADIERKPVKDDNLHFVQGDVSDETLGKASIGTAKTVVIMGDSRLSPTARDAKAVLAVLAVETLNPKAYSIVELSKRENIVHCRRANADEIIVVGELSSGLIARTALNHGLGRVTTEILRSGDGSELYKVAVPPSMVGRTFLDVFTEIKRRNLGIAIATYRDDERQRVNPSSEYVMRADDFVIVVAEERPAL